MIEKLSIIIPAKNESAGLSVILPELRRCHPEAEIIVVDDGSDDDTEAVCRRHGVTPVRHPYSMGNGAAVKSGARAATGTLLLFMDADSQHRPQDIEPLVSMLEQGYDMIVGERSGESQASLGRRIANDFYNTFSSWITGQRIGDLTSGFRVARAGKFKEFLHLLPNGFSYPTTITMAFFRSGYSVGYHPISVKKRIGTSHINPLKDGLRFLLIIFKIGTLFSPLKIFIPVALLYFVLGTGYYAFTFITAHRFTNMSALLLTSAVTIFLMGLVSEQITSLLYAKNTES